MNTLNQSIASHGHPLFPVSGGAAYCPPQDAALPMALHLHPSKPLRPSPSQRASLLASDGGGRHGKLVVEVETGDVRLKQQSSSALVGGFLHSLLQKKELEQRSTQPRITLAVSVVSAVKLERKQMDQIAKKMQKLTGFQDLKLENTVDASLIAGFVISYGSDDVHVIDLSVKGQLAQIAARLETSDQRQGWNLSGGL